MDFSDCKTVLQVLLTDQQITNVAGIFQDNNKYVQPLLPIAREGHDEGEEKDRDGVGCAHEHLDSPPR
jgi:hypothetical protein